MSKTDQLSDLPANSICCSTETRMVRLDGAVPEVERTYLTLNGTPEGFHWLARRLTRMANSAAERETGNSVIIDPRDFSGGPVKLEGWHALDLACRQK